MKLYHSIDHLASDKRGTVVTIGTFDGVHKGHQFILKRLNLIAHQKSLSSVVFTFNSHPRHVLFPDDQKLRLLNSIDQKIGKLEELGVQYCLIHKFTKEFSRIDSIHFVRDILVNKLNMKHMIVGYDHHFGKNREGSFDELSKLSELYNFDLEKAPPQKFKEITISSTKIRKLLIKGDIQKANRLLGYNYSLDGRVCRGIQLGSKIGFPTANIKINDKWKLIPFSGVYVVKVYIINKAYFGMLNIGTPSLGANAYQLEVHIFNFSKEVYDKDISIIFIKRLRDEKKFDNIEELKSQLIKDQSNSKKFLNILK